MALKIVRLRKSAAAALFLLILPMTWTAPVGGADGDLVETVWTEADSPVVLSSSIEIGPEERLRIDPGVQVRLDPDVGIQVKGELRVIGTETSPVTFVSNTTGPIVPDTWADVRLHADSVGREHLVRWAVFSGADAGLLVSAATVTVEDSVFDTCRYGILSRANATVDVIRSTFINNSALGLEWETGAKGTVRDSTFIGNVVGAYFFNGVSPTVENCTFIDNYHHLSFAQDANATVVGSTLENATAEHFECYWNSSPLFLDVTITGSDEARVYLRGGCRPRLFGGTPISTLRVDTTDNMSYAVAVVPITIMVMNDEGKLLEEANITLKGASGDVLAKGSTNAEGRLSGGYMSTYTVDAQGGLDRENPHTAVVEWRGHNQSFRVDPRDLSRERVLELELATSSPEPTEWDLLVWVTLVITFFLVGVVSGVLWRRRST
jgi:hypothetical protein